MIKSIISNTTNKVTISGVVISKNSEKLIRDCLTSLNFCDELILIDTGITDDTVSVAKDVGAIIIECKQGSFDTWRNRGLKHASSEWLLYLDTDERITPELRAEILSKIQQPKQYVAYAIPRNNHILGKLFKYSGEYPDFQKRLFCRSHLKKWQGLLHEEPQIDGKLGHLINPLIHLKHDNFSDMIDKTNIWSEKEAKLLYDSNHPQMAPWRFLRIMITEGYLKFVKQKAYMDGYAGIMYGIYQIWSKVLTYSKLWEMQRNIKSITDSTIK